MTRCGWVSVATATSPSGRAATDTGAVSDVDPAGGIDVAIFAKNNVERARFRGRVCGQPCANLENGFFVRGIDNEARHRRLQHIVAAVHAAVNRAEPGADFGKHAALRGEIAFLRVKRRSGECRDAQGGEPADEGGEARHEASDYYERGAVARLCDRCFQMKAPFAHQSRRNRRRSIERARRRPAALQGLPSSVSMSTEFI